MSRTKTATLILYYLIYNRQIFHKNRTTTAQFSVLTVQGVDSPRGVKLSLIPAFYQYKLFLIVEVVNFNKIKRISVDDSLVRTNKIGFFFNYNNLVFGNAFVSISNDTS